MADNVPYIDGNNALISIASDDVAGKQMQRIKLDIGGDGATSPVTVDNPLPADIRSFTTSYAPGYEISENVMTGLACDPTGAQKNRGQVLTDEGGYISNFAGTSLAVTIGTCVFTNGSPIVTGTGFSAYNLHYGDYVYLTADGSSFGKQVDSFTDTEITLAENYAGTGGTGAASRQIMKDKPGAGASVTVANGTCILTSGTTTGAITELERDVDYYPLRKRTVATFSAAPGANSTTYIQFYNEQYASPSTFARFKFTGTSTTQVVCETGWNPLGSVSAAETQSTNVFLPGVITAAHEYQIIATFDGVKFFVDRVLVAFHTTVCPHMGDLLTSSIYIVNGTSPSSYTVTIGVDACKNYNEVDICTNENQVVMTQLAPDRTLPIWAPNATTPLTIDTQGYSSLRFQIPTAGTASVLTPSWSDDGTNFFTGGGFNPVGGGAYVATITNATAGGWTIPRLFRWFRLSAASTQTGGVIVSLSNAVGQPVNPTSTTAVSGNVACALNAGTNAVGDFGLQARANATGAASKTHLISAATTNATVARAAACRFLGYRITNTNAAFRYVKLHNLATTPTAGTTAVVETIGVPGSSHIFGG
jgi:hypothetical protein